jgi:hypothetical protein
MESKMKKLKKLLEGLVTIMLLVSTGLVVIAAYLAVYGVMLGIPVSVVVLVVYGVLKMVGIL